MRDRLVTDRNVARRGAERVPLNVVSWENREHKLSG